MSVEFDTRQSAMQSATIKIFLVFGDPKRLRTAEISNWTGKAVAAPRVENGQSSGSRLPESDREEMEVFLSRVHQLLPVLGADFLVPLAASHERGQRGGLLVCDIKGLHAQGMRGASGFLVLRGSHAVLQERASTDRHPYITQLRNVLIGEGKLLKGAASYEFVTDVEFSSPSAAASIIHGGTANGLTAWKTEDGRTLKEIEADSNP